MSPKVLIVLESSYRFVQSPIDFSYTVLVDALESSGMDVTKAHRQSDPDADFQNFDFSTHDLTQYDVIWLIGLEGRNSSNGSGSSNPALPLAQRTAISNFMNEGGGVFATGDHDSLGSVLCGHLPRVRAMRAWFGPNDTTSPMEADFPHNFLPFGTVRADTVQENPAGDYTQGEPEEVYVYFENQSDSIPQPLEVVQPTHPILRRNGRDITVYPDHMHEGNTIGAVEDGPDAAAIRAAYEADHPILGAGNDEFPALGGAREFPRVIATGQVREQRQRRASSNASIVDSVLAEPKAVNTLCIYDGWRVGVGRIVTGATFHHYIDLNLTGDSEINTQAEFDRTGPDAAKGEGFGYGPADPRVFDDIKGVFVNITNWLARPRRTFQLILERSTFGEDETIGMMAFEGAVLVSVNGLRPSEFPGGGITTLSPSQTQLNAWAPNVAPEGAPGFVIEPTGLSTDSPPLADRVQRFTFTYRVRFTGNAFDFADDLRDVRVNAVLAPTMGDSLEDTALIRLVKSANPYSLDFANGNDTPWLSSDVRVFPVVAGSSLFGTSLPANATAAQARQFIVNLTNSITPAQFESLSLSQSGSALSPFERTTDSNERVYNFAIARVRLNGQAAVADDTRVFFRIFTSQTTAALTYRLGAGDQPIEGYRRTNNAAPIALPGVTPAGDAWLSFPFFARDRDSAPENQTDPENVEDINPVAGSEVSTFFGALIDNNLTTPYLPPSPNSGASPIPLSAHLMGEHQCLVAQIEFAGAPIPNGARPNTSDKLAQRNIAFSEIANPGDEASRVAFHTFEIAATPGIITDSLPPDELLLEWPVPPPDGTSVHISLSTWSAEVVVALADRFYPRHEITVVDDNTIALPGGGSRYVPIPRSLKRQNGIVAARFPFGVKRGQRFDVSVRQITNEIRRRPVVPLERPIELAEARKLLAGIQIFAGEFDDQIPRGVFDIGDNRTLITDLSVIDQPVVDQEGDFALLIEQPSREDIQIARREAADWRETVGGFQLGVPVSVKDAMVAHYTRLYSVMRWRSEQPSFSARWRITFLRYVDMLAEKLIALGGNPVAVTPTPNGAVDVMIPGEEPGGGEPDDGGEGPGGGEPDDSKDDPFFEPGDDDLLDDTQGLEGPQTANPLVRSGKISGLLYDHFGDVEGFLLELYNGEHLRFFSREAAIADLANMAWLKRYVVTVITTSSTSRRVRRLLIRGYASE
ncbi:MAG: hypothetical protein EA353_09755 [Puniceicoccaceae bacterium]|nr:MAG: hypothetical protein EA353_09755 [Puniceicoccaceae bacterium]